MRIRVNAVAPGPAETQILAQSGLTAEAIQAIKADEVRRIPLGRGGHPDDVARWIVTLADPAADWITGQVITVDDHHLVAALQVQGDLRVGGKLCLAREPVLNQKPSASHTPPTPVERAAVRWGGWWRSRSGARRPGAARPGQHQVGAEPVGDVVGNALQHPQRILQPVPARHLDHDRRRCREGLVLE
jgi:Enoyl-(Acyl carrier protein) reductase